MKELHNHGFVKYEPSQDREFSSKVHLTIFWSSSGTSSDQKLVTLKNLSKQTLTIRKSNFYDNKNQEKNGYPSPDYNQNLINNNQLSEPDYWENEKDDTNEYCIHVEKEFIPPIYFEVQSFFHEQNQSKYEAERFFNHYEAIGWLVGGKTPMKDWKAAVRYWILNIDRFTSKNQFTSSLKPPGHKPSTDYSIPL
ncbi:MAG: hypothetical protein JEZ14_25945 [Marinilabiliaceae bacterium]|nr:hypothetical protein [Marinilabiliaceae bacterium]